MAIGFDLRRRGALRIEPDDFDPTRHGVFLGQIETRRRRHAAGERHASEHENQTERDAHRAAQVESSTLARSRPRARRASMMDPGLASAAARKISPASVLTMA